MASVDDGQSATGAISRPLSRADQELIFRQATAGFVRQHEDQFADGMNDGELWHALEDCLGIFGGSGGLDRPSISYCGAGLKIWGAWEVFNQVTAVPLFSGAATLAMAREV